MKTSIKVTDARRARVVTVSGPLTYPEGTELLRNTIRSRIAEGDSNFVVDLLAVPFVDSSGIGEIVASYKRARERGGVVRLAMRDQPHLAFTYCHLDRMFDIDDSRRGALKRFDQAQPKDTGPKSP
jgi:anti-sigma B factor antagonist